MLLLLNSTISIIIDGVAEIVFDDLDIDRTEPYIMTIRAFDSNGQEVESITRNIRLGILCSLNLQAVS